jgi:hypothetical protein
LLVATVAGGLARWINAAPGSAAALFGFVFLLAALVFLVAAATLSYLTVTRYLRF